MTGCRILVFEFLIAIGTSLLALNSYHNNTTTMSHHLLFFFGMISSDLPPETVAQLLWGKDWSLERPGDRIRAVEWLQAYMLCASNSATDMGMTCWSYILSKHWELVRKDLDTALPLQRRMSLVLSTTTQHPLPTLMSRRGFRRFTMPATTLLTRALPTIG